MWSSYTIIWVYVVVLHNNLGFCGHLTQYSGFMWSFYTIFWVPEARKWKAGAACGQPACGGRTPTMFYSGCAKWFNGVGLVVSAPPPQ